MKFLKNDELCAMSGTSFNAFSQIHQIHPNI